MKLVLSEGALAEVREAHDRYEREQEGLGARFEAELDEVLALAAIALAAGSPVGGMLRVLAVSHQKRRPRYWRSTTDPDAE